MSEFSIYFGLGFEHIVNWHAYDHMLFLVALTMSYSLKEWKRLGLIVTAFTLGHTITLACVTLSIIHVNALVVEFLIPLTILLTAVPNLFEISQKYKRPVSYNSIIAIFFGFIHGMGLANNLVGLIGSRDELFVPLWSFNIGVEVGQLIIVCIVLTISFIFTEIFGILHQIWMRVVSIAIIGIALWLLIENRVW